MSVVMQIKLKDHKSQVYLGHIEIFNFFAKKITIISLFRQIFHTGHFDEFHFYEDQIWIEFVNLFLIHQL